MLSKSEKLWINSLKEKKIRYLRQQFIAEGSRLILDLIKTAPDKLQMICATKTWALNNESDLQNHNPKLKIVELSVLHAVSSLKTTDEVLAVFDFPEIDVNRTPQSNVLLYLDRIRDPGNLGSIIRSADWFGIQQIYCSLDTVDPFNNKCVQATMSSIMRVAVIHCSWDQMLIDFKNINKFATVLNGQPYYEIEKTGSQLICIGNEAQGLSDPIINSCNKTISIPSNKSLGAESLNAAIASSILMAWFADPRAPNN
ncbi:MAG: RNA methyltransferase [Saprospiraceae bacterium]|nr:RNA methyltransferase [Saprospiraceae bacterium]